MHPQGRRNVTVRPAFELQTPNIKNLGCFRWSHTTFNPHFFSNISGGMYHDSRSRPLSAITSAQLNYKAPTFPSHKNNLSWEFNREEDSPVSRPGEKKTPIFLVWLLSSKKKSRGKKTSHLLISTSPKGVNEDTSCFLLFTDPTTHPPTHVPTHTRMHTCTHA